MKLINTTNNFRAGKIAENSKNWQELTSDRWLLNVVRGDFVEFDDVPLQGNIPRDLHLPKADQKALDDSLKELLKCGVIESCNPKHECQGFYSTVFPRMKKDGSARVILNLKHLNEHTERVHFKMDTIKDAIRLMKKNCLFASVDFKHAYYSVRIAKKDRKFFRFKWKGHHFQFTALPQGYSPAPRLFTKLLKPVFAYLRGIGLVIVGFIDDSLLVFYNQGDWTEEVKKVIEFFDSLGLTVHLEKSVIIPVHIIEYLGFILNSQKMTVQLTNRKKEKIKKLALQLLKSKQVTIQDLAQFIGNLVAAEPGVPMAALHYKPLEIVRNRGLKLSAGDYSAAVTLDQDARAEITWWVCNIMTAEKQVETPIISLTLLTDASGSGWGATTGGISSGGHWSPFESEQHINWKELKAAYLGLQTFCASAEGIHIHLKLDNTTAVACIQKQGSTKVKLMKLTQDIYEWATERNIVLSASHIPGVENVQADRESRRKNIDSEWMLDKNCFMKLTKVFRKPDIDLFATRLNSQLEKYVSWRPDPFACHVDAFTMEWSLIFGYIFPPFSVMGKVLQKIEQDQATALVVAPLWTTQAWFPRALSMLVAPPCILPKNCLHLPMDKSRQHPLDRLRLVAMVLSGKRFDREVFQQKCPVSCWGLGGVAPKDSIAHINQDGVNFVANGRLIHCRHL